MKTKQEYQQILEDQFKHWSLEIEKLKASADKAKAESKIKYYEEIEKLREKQLGIRDKIDQLKDSGESAWQDLKIGIESSFHDLGEGIKSAVSRFK